MIFGTLRRVAGFLVWVVFLTKAVLAQSGTRTLTFNTAAFVNPAPFTFGNAPRSVLRGPRLATIDLTLERSLPLTARVRAEIRAEAYNLLNRANFSLPGFTFGAADFGVISSARAARTVQLGARLTF
jgi:hypothetical protein